MPSASGGLFVAYVVTVVALHSLDRELLWGRFPTVEIDDGTRYNETVTPSRGAVPQRG